MPLKGVSGSGLDYEWDKDYFAASPRSPATRYSRDYGTIIEHQATRHSSLTRAPEPSTFAKVTVTRTKSVIGDDGREYPVPVEPPRKNIRTPGWSKGLEWCDSNEDVEGNVNVSPGGGSKPGVYETRVGYHKRIDGEENWFDYDIGTPPKAL